MQYARNGYIAYIFSNMTYTLSQYIYILRLNLALLETIQAINLYDVHIYIHTH